MQPAARPRIVLASTSPFRRQLLQKLGIEFDTASPGTDETALPGESPSELVARLAEAKAASIAGQTPGSLVIGSDQVACIDDRILGKPGNRENAIDQLRATSGQSVHFHTGLCLYNADAGAKQTIVEPYTVHFRALDDEQIRRYVDRERPFDCAGSFKSEGLGITLFSALEGRDPNTLIGLPLIALTEMFANEGIELP